MIRRVALTVTTVALASIGATEGWWGDVAAWRVPPPPPWVADATDRFFANVLEPMYVLLAFTHLCIWGVLWRQRAPREKAPARWMRRFVATKFFLWFGLAGGRVFAEWKGPLYALMTVVVAVASVALVVAMFRAYVLPAIRRGPEPPSDDPPLPVYAGPNRRIGLVDRRRRRLA